MAILVVGTLAFDALETPFGKIDKIIGGSGTFISVSASFFHRPIHVVSIIGGDFPAETMDDMRARGVDFEGVEVRPNEKSFFWAGKYSMDLNSRETLATELNVLADFKPVLPPAAQNPAYVLLGNLSPDVQQSVIAQLKTRPRLIIMDTMNYWMDTQMDAVLKTLKLIDVLTINDEEARQLAGEYSLVKAARKILTFGPKYLIVKKGENGALLFHEKQVFFCPALPLETVFDPTGAGDTFAGGFVGYLAAKNAVGFEAMKNAVLYGSTMASFCVEKFGPTRLFELTHDEIRRRFQQFLTLTQFEKDLIDE